MDEILYFYRKMTCENVRVVVLDTYWARHLVSQVNLGDVGFTEEGEETLRNYMKGILPTEFPKKWNDAKKIYTPFHLAGIEKEHWIALEIDLSEWSINVYDCNKKLYSDKEIHDALDPIHQGVPRLLTNYKPLATNLPGAWRHFKGKPLDICRMDKLKVNKRGYVLCC